MPPGTAWGGEGDRFCMVREAIAAQWQCERRLEPVMAAGRREVL
jgi:hypothetical protein